MKPSYHLSSFPLLFLKVHISSGPHLSITARHSFLQVKRLPRRNRKVPGAVVRGGGVCLHSISSRGNGAGRMFRVAPGAGELLSYNWQCVRKSQAARSLQVSSWFGGEKHGADGMSGGCLTISIMIMMEMGSVCSVRCLLLMWHFILIINPVVKCWQRPLLLSSSHDRRRKENDWKASDLRSFAFINRAAKRL